MRRYLVIAVAVVLSPFVLAGLIVGVSIALVLAAIGILLYKAAGGEREIQS